MGFPVVIVWEDAGLTTTPHGDLQVVMSSAGVKRLEMAITVSICAIKLRDAPQLPTQAAAFISATESLPADQISTVTGDIMTVIMYLLLMRQAIQEGNGIAVHISAA